jgi:hypothetical protein
MDRYVSGAMALILPIMLALALGSQAGCAARPHWAGEWHGERALPLEEGMDPAIHATLVRVRLTLRPDGTFRLIEHGFWKDGDASFGVRAASLTVREFAGRPVAYLGADAQEVNQPIDLRWLGDGAIEFRGHRGSGAPPVVLRRVAPGR